MSTCFIYIHNPKHPNKIGEFHSAYSTETFTDGYIFETEEDIRDIFLQQWQWVRNKGFLLMVDSAHPEMVLSYPPKARSKYLQPDHPLATSVQQFYTQFPNTSLALED